MWQSVSRSNEAGRMYLRECECNLSGGVIEIISPGRAPVHFLESAMNENLAGAGRSESIGQTNKGLNVDQQLCWALFSVRFKWTIRVSGGWGAWSLTCCFLY